MLLLVDCYTVVMLLFLLAWDAQLMKKKLSKHNNWLYCSSAALYLSVSGSESTSHWHSKEFAALAQKSKPKKNALPSARRFWHVIVLSFLWKINEARLQKDSLDILHLNLLCDCCWDLFFESFRSIATQQLNVWRPDCQNHCRLAKSPVLCYWTQVQPKAVQHPGRQVRHQHCPISSQKTSLKLQPHTSKEECCNLDCVCGMPFQHGEACSVHNCAELQMTLATYG